MERIGRFDGTDRVGRGRACDAAPTPQPNAPLAWSSRRVHSPDLLRPVSHAASPPHLLTCGLPPPQPPIPLPATTHRTATPPTCTAAESTSTRRSTGEGSTGGGLPLAPRARETSFHEPLRCMPGTARGALHVSPRPPLRGRNRGAPVCRRDVASPDGPDAPHPAAEPLAGAGEGYHLSEDLAPPTRRRYLKGTQGPRRTLAWHRSTPCVAPAALLLLARDQRTRYEISPPPMPTSTDRDDGHQQRQCRRVGSADVELHAAMALADMAGVDHPLPAQQQHHAAIAAAAAVPKQATTEHEDEELASTRLSLELGNVGIQSSPCSSSSSGAGQQQPLQAASSAAVPGYGPSRPRSMLTEAEKEAKRLRRVLANRESARQTILRRQAIRDELARKVADLASQNENMKKEKDMVLEQYMSLKETNKQLKQQVAKTTKKKPSSTQATTPMDIVSSAQHAEASPPPTPPQPSFLYSAPPPTMPVPYVWGSWPPCGPGAYEHGGNPAGAAGHVPPPLCLPPACAWYYPVVTAADPRGSPTSYVQPFQEPTGSPGGGGTAGEETDEDDDPCSLTLAIDAADNKKSAAAGANSHQTSAGVVGAVGLQVALSSREKAATTAEARRRRKELTKLKQMHAGSRHGAGDHW